MRDRAGDVRVQRGDSVLGEEEGAQTRHQREIRECGDVVVGQVEGVMVLVGGWVSLRCAAGVIGESSWMGGREVRRVGEVVLWRRRDFRSRGSCGLCLSHHSSFSDVLEMLGPAWLMAFSRPRARRVRE